MPSASSRVLAAVRVWPWVAEPLMVTAPLGTWFCRRRLTVTVAA